MDPQYDFLPDLQKEIPMQIANQPQPRRRVELVLLLNANIEFRTRKSSRDPFQKLADGTSALDGTIEVGCVECKVRT